MEAVLDGARWRAAAAAHRTRVERWTVPHRDRRRRGEAHPVLDFLFTYYSLRPVRLEQWHPGPGVRLHDADEFLDQPGYVRDGAGVRLDPAALPHRIGATAAFVRALLVATASRAPRLGCFGLHEWAMVYRTDAPRHDAVPLRLGAAGTDAVLEQLPVHCTHHDAFRFFTDAARPLNALAPGRADHVEHEQPGCLHATMDLYKWAYKLAPPRRRSCWPTASHSPSTCGGSTCGRAPTTSPTWATRPSASRRGPGGPSTPAPRPASRSAPLPS